MKQSKYRLIFLLILALLCFESNTNAQLTGVKTIKVSGGNYATFTAAINALNTLGVGTGGVIFNVDAGFSSIENCPIITASGSITNPIVFQRTGSGSNPVIKPTGTAGTTDAGVTINGGDYITFDGIDISINSGSAVEFGYYIKNASATNGAQNNTIKNCKITLNRANTSSKAVYQNAVTITPTNITGANSYNYYQYLSIENSYQGIYSEGNATYPDLNIEISSCTIGANTSNDIGNGTSKLSGIYALNTSEISIFNNEIRNLTTTGTVNLNGLFLDKLQGTNNLIYNNKIYNLKTTNTSSNAIIYGLYTEINSGMKADIYNNVIYSLQSSISPANVKIVIRALSAGLISSSTGVANYYHNTVRIEEDQFPSSSCLYIGSYGTYNIKNNIFSNFSTAGSTSKRYCIAITNGIVQFNADYNDYYIASGTNNFVGIYGSLDRATLSDWQLYTSQDPNTLNTNPNFTSATDLKPSTGNFITGTAIAGITTDIINVSRSNPPDIGAYEGSEAGRWLGSNSSDWLLPANWDNGALPSAIDNVNINSWSTYQPHITSSPVSPAVCNNLTINSGASLCIDAGKALTVSGILSNNSGTTGLLLKSDATGTASLKNNTPGINASVERYISDSLQFHMLSSPVSSQSIASVVTSSDSLYTWDETTGNWVSYTDAIFSAINGGSNFTTARAYAFNNSTIVTKNFTGELNQGSIGIPITYTSGTYQGWNFIANPYPSSIDWNAATGWSRSMLEDAGSGERAFWIWNPSLGNYGTYISNTGGTGTINVTNNITIGQGFWVKAASAATLTMDNNVRVHSTQAFLKSSASTDILRLKVSAMSNSYCDEIIIKFGYPNDSGGSEKMFSINPAAPGLYCTKNNKKWSINNLNTITQNSMVAVNFIAGVNGIYNIKAAELSSFTSPAYIYLEDLKTNTIQELNQNDTYTFTSLTSDATDRFRLIFSLAPLNINNVGINNNNIYTYDNTLYINNKENIKQITVYNMLGQLLKIINNTKNLTSFSLNDLPANYYIVKMISDKNVHTAKVFIK